MTPQIPLAGGHYYHIYNRGNNGETIFRTAENYRYFLELYARHIEPVATTFAFCLLPNHFHFLNYIRTEEEQRSWLLAREGGEGESCQLLESWQLSPSPPSRAFKNLFIAYAMAFSIRYKRTGSLFQKPFKRRLVDSDRYFAALVRYIHRNPEKHGLNADFCERPWSSYGAILGEGAGSGSKMPSFEKMASLSLSLRRDDVLAQFGGRAPFIALHETELDERAIAEYVIE
jgi:REP element-mobilizing transposase RayT